MLRTSITRNSNNAIEALSFKDRLLWYLSRNGMMWSTSEDDHYIYLCGLVIHLTVALGALFQSSCIPLSHSPFTPFIFRPTVAISLPGQGTKAADGICSPCSVHDR